MRSPAALLVAAGLLGAPQPAGAQLDVTYLGNAGFLLEGGGRRVLVDALFGTGLPGYPLVPDELRAQLESGRHPAGGVHLALATHHHPDHFDAEAVLRFLEASPAARFVSTPQAVERLRAAAGERTDLLERVESADPPSGGRLLLAHAGVELEALDLHHGAGTTARNLGFLARMGGVRWLHVGDTEVTAREIAPLELSEAGIDVALLPDWMLSREPWTETVREELPSRVIVAMHERRGGDAERRRRVAAAFPGARWFSAGESARFEASISSGDAAEEEVRAAERAFARTMAERDHGAFASFVSEEAVFLGREILRGRAAVAEGWKRLFESDEAPFSWEPERVVVLDSGELAFSTGPVYGRDGERTGTFNSTWRREADGVWRVVFDVGCPPCGR